MARVLVLDDDVISGQLMTKLLRKRIHEVHVCTRSVDAWRRLDTTPVDLMVLDTELEGEHGCDVLEAIRRDVIFRDLSVLVCSSNSSRAVVAKYISLGVQGIVVKPYSADRINSEVERAVAHPWRHRHFEPVNSVMERTGLTSGDLSRLYRDAALEIDAAVLDLQALREDAANAKGLARLTALRSCGLNVGFKLLATLADEARGLAMRSESERLGQLLDRLPVARRLLALEGGHDPAGPDGAGGGDPAASPASGIGAA